MRNLQVSLMRPLRAFILLLLFGCLMAQAQTGVGVVPGRTELHVQPGERATGQVEVDNPTSVPLIIDASLSDVYQQLDGSMLFLEAGSLPASLGPWLALDPVRFPLQPDGTATVTYSISVPDTAAPGSYIGLVFFQPATDDQPEQTGNALGVRSQVRVGHIVYVHVGEGTREGQINGITYRQPDTDDEAAAVRVTFQNLGSSLLRLSGGVEIRGLDGTLVAEQGIGDVASFPGATHDVTFYLPEPLPQGEYVALAVLDYGEADVVMGEARFTVP